MLFAANTVDKMKQMLDAVIVGGGPTGLAAALIARNCGLEVAIVEPQNGTIDKACGEGLMPGAVALLATMGVRDLPAFPFYGISYIRGTQRVEARFSQGHGLGIRRLALHRAMADAADAAGVQRVNGRVTDIQDNGQQVEARLHDGTTMTARWAIAADGLHSPTRKRLGLVTPTHWPERIGVRQHFLTAPWSENVEVYWTDDAEIYVTPVSDDSVGVAVLTRKIPQQGGGANILQHALDHVPALARRLGDHCSHLRGAGPFAQGVRQRVVGRVLLVGDAAGYLDPITGEGLRLGFATARAAVTAIAQDRPQDYERAWWSITRRYRWMTGALLRIAGHPTTRSWMFPVLTRAPQLMDLTLGLLDEDSGPERAALPG